MLLTIDLGNTNVTCGVYREEHLERTFRFQTVRSRTSDEYAATLLQLLQLYEISRHDIDSAILASVVPPVTETLQRAVETCLGFRAMVVGPGLKTGVSVLYDNPHDVGTDRIVNAVAAYHQVQGAVIVVDFGTATTFDCISAKGEYVGGAIAPGLEVSMVALVERAAKLRPIEIAEPPAVIGRTTQHSLQSGVVFGYASLVDGMVDRIRAELGQESAVIATGGMAALLAQHTTKIQRVDPTLTLEGLRLLYTRNRKR